MVRQNVLPGEPTNGKGTICIHFLVRDEQGPCIEPHVLYPAGKGKLEARPTRVRIACDPKKKVSPVRVGKVISITHRTEEVSAVTCLKCKATKEYKDAIETR